MKIQESLDQLVSILQSVNEDQMNEYFPHIAEALDIDLSEVENDKESMIDAIREAVSLVEEDDVTAVVKEIGSFFMEEADEDDEDEDEVEESKTKKYKKESKTVKKEEDEDDEDDDEEDDDEEVAESKHKKMKKEGYHITPSDVDLSEDTDAIFNGETLTEEFQTKAKTIFEAAVVRKVNEKLDQIVEEYDDLFEEKLEEATNDLTEKVDEYLTYVATEWASDNEIALEGAIRNEMTESFINTLKGVFTEHYIDVPNEKMDMIEDLQSKVEELESGLNESLDENAKLSKQLRESSNDDVFHEVTSGLTEFQKDKFRRLSEGIDKETDTEDYREKLSIIKESYFSTDRTVMTEDFDDDEGIEDESKVLSGPVASYVKSLNMLGKR